MLIDFLLLIKQSSQISFFSCPRLNQFINTSRIDITFMNAAKLCAHSDLFGFAKIISRIKIGQFVFDDIPPEMIEVESNHINVQADFAVGVIGDSIEPTYKDGDVLLIKKHPSVNVGEIGIFMINGEAFVKDFAGEILKSHNEKHENIMVTDQTICLGKVINKIEEAR